MSYQISMWLVNAYASSSFLTIALTKHLASSYWRGCTQKFQVLLSEKMKLEEIW